MCRCDRQEDSSPSPSSVLLQRYNCNEMLPGMEEIDVSKIGRDGGSNRSGCLLPLYVFVYIFTSFTSSQ